MKKIVIFIFVCLLIGYSSVLYAADSTREVTFSWKYTAEEEQILVDNNGGYRIWQNDEIVEYVDASARRVTISYTAIQVKNDFHITAYIFDENDERLESDPSDNVHLDHYVKAKITKITKREET